MENNPGVSMKRLRHERRARGGCSNCDNYSGKYYLCSSCRDEFRKRQVRFKQGIKKVTRDPRRLAVWDESAGNKELINALTSKGISFRDLNQLKDFADLLNRSTRTIQGWIFEGRVPRPALWREIENILDKPIPTLFPQLTEQRDKSIQNNGSPNQTSERSNLHAN
ncbi:hypothetical protein [Paenibacillus taichungensis]